MILEHLGLPLPNFLNACFSLKLKKRPAERVLENAEGFCSYSFKILLANIFANLVFCRQVRSICICPRQRSRTSGESMGAGRGMAIHIAGKPYTVMQSLIQ
jgi:hypothetical protein